MQSSGIPGDVAWPAVVPVPSTMDALHVREFGGPEVLRMESIPVPEIGPGEVLVRVAAVSVGRLLDVVARAGRHPYVDIPLPHVFGGENAGTLAAVGDEVTDLAVGDHVAVLPGIVMGEDEMTRAGYYELSPNMRILGIHYQGADAEYVRVPAHTVFRVPDGVTPVEAVAVVAAGAIAMNQFDRAGGVGPESRVIVQGATSALGSTTALLARHLGAEVIVTSRHESKRARLHELGFEHVLDAIDGSFVETAREIFGGRGATVIVDNLGAPLIWDHGFEVLGPGGAVVSSGAFLGHHVTLDLQRLYSLGQRVIGVRTANLESSRRLWDEVGRGFRSIVDRVYPLAEAPAAHAYVESSGNVGRVALTIDTTAGD